MTRRPCLDVEQWAVTHSGKGVFTFALEADCDVNVEFRSTSQFVVEVANASGELLYLGCGNVFGYHARIIGGSKLVVSGENDMGLAYKFVLEPYVKGEVVDPVPVAVITDMAKPDPAKAVIREYIRAEVEKRVGVDADDVVKDLDDDEFDWDEGDEDEEDEVPDSEYMEQVDIEDYIPPEQEDEKVGDDESPAGTEEAEPPESGEAEKPSKLANG